LIILPRKPIRRLQKYRPPLEGRVGKLRLDFNENTVGCAPEVVRALRRLLSREGLSCYPEYQESREKLARYFGVAPEELVLANGTDDALKVICETFVDPGDLLVVPAPTFPVYQFYHTVAGGRTVRVACNQHFCLPLDKFIAAAKRGARWAALATPNNPTGTTVPPESLRKILKATPKTLVVVDEAYGHFSGETVLPWIREFPNLVVSRTFSKAFGLAALRVGCLFANPELAEVMRRGQNPFPVNSLALACACVAVEHEEYVRRYVAEVLRNRAQLCRWFEEHGIAYVPSSANFVLARVGLHAPEIAQRLRAAGILVRDWSYDPHLRGFLRFTVGSRAQMRRLYTELRRLEQLIDTRNGQKDWRNFVAYSATGWFT
jgi:histidinol-phosphate aminotransferase